MTDIVRERWCEVLETGHAEDEQDFFLAGGHSLLAVRLTSALRADLDIPVPVSALFESRTLGAYTAQVQDLLATESRGAGRP
ncbi:phosphopantetheine-binding protein [Nocardiopsis sp. NPDC049922]|uniref:phosphopantetheine-binding protein n=1 Tax=Nocardiopsis sp. NPDC049922 TaxID=3155157 RepID=UPI0033FE2FF8